MTTNPGARPDGRDPYRIESILVAGDLDRRPEPALGAAAAIAELYAASLHPVYAVECLGSTPRALAECVLTRAGEVGASLVVLGIPASGHSTARGRRALRRLISALPVSSLLLSGPLNLPLRSAWLSLDETELAEGLLAEACRWMGLLRGPPGRPVGVRRRTELRLHYSATSPREWRQYEQALDSAVGEVRSRSWFSDTLDLQPQVTWEGDRAEVILGTSRRDVGDLLVMGYRAGDDLVSRVLDEARRPVLLLPRRHRAGGGATPPSPGRIVPVVVPA